MLDRSGVASQMRADFLELQEQRVSDRCDRRHLFNTATRGVIMPQRDLDTRDEAYKKFAAENGYGYVDMDASRAFEAGWEAAITERGKTPEMWIPEMPKGERVGYREGSRRPGALGEPSDAQVDAAIDVFNDPQHEYAGIAMRAALRAAWREGETR